ncbi:PASTA domain-containing protein [Blattabacterium cuenoti]|uniref:PASTA domain-containing protein n=1 Tax=Blattabacterium cuenoti TaxID=1653831 RepID=UPI00163B8F8A|nr:PASTA domain-containing protein [Blattabacterium cuenoti]
MKYYKYCLIILINLLIAIYILYNITNVALNWVNIYTKHGSYVIVPNISNLTIKQSVSLLNQLGLKYEISESEYNPSFKPNQILYFLPEAGNHVKIGRSIYIKVNATHYKTTVLPNIFNKKKRIAIKLLHANHIYVDKIKYINNISKNTIYKALLKGKNITSGCVLPVKHQITLIIGNGYYIKNNYYVIPNVNGMPIHNAIPLLNKQLFNNIHIIIDNMNSLLYNDKFDNNSLIYRQSPNPGHITPDKNISIDLWITNYTNTNHNEQNNHTTNNDNKKIDISQQNNNSYKPYQKDDVNDIKNNN